MSKLVYVSTRSAGPTDTYIIKSIPAKVEHGRKRTNKPHNQEKEKENRKKELKNRGIIATILPHEQTPQL
jgi:hypothetical protein